MVGKRKIIIAILGVIALTVIALVKDINTSNAIVTLIGIYITGNVTGKIGLKNTSEVREDK